MVEFALRVSSSAIIPMDIYFQSIRPSWAFCYRHRKACQDPTAPAMPNIVVAGEGLTFGLVRGALTDIMTVLRDDAACQKRYF
jgi:hypothetical protein